MLGILLIIYQSVDFLLVGMVRRVVMLQVVGVGRCGGWNYFGVCMGQRLN